MLANGRARPRAQALFPRGSLSLGQNLLSKLVHGCLPHADSVFSAGVSWGAHWHPCCGYRPKPGLLGKTTQCLWFEAVKGGGVGRQGPLLYPFYRCQWGLGPGFDLPLCKVAITSPLCEPTSKYFFLIMEFRMFGENLFFLSICQAIK